MQIGKSVFCYMLINILFDEGTMRNKLFELKQTLKRLGIEKYSDKINNLIKVATPLDDIYIRNEPVNKDGGGLPMAQNTLSDAEKKILENSKQLFDLFKKINTKFELHTLPENLQLADTLRDPPSLVLGAVKQGKIEEVMQDKLTDKENIQAGKTIDPNKMEEIIGWVKLKSNPSKAIIIWGLGELSQNLTDPVSTEATWTLHDILHILENESKMKGRPKEIKQNIQAIEDMLRDPDLDPKYKDITKAYEDFVTNYTPNVEHFDTYATTFAALVSGEPEIEAIFKKIEENEILKKQLKIDIKNVMYVQDVLDSMTDKFIFLP